jgi:hypothetical protein
MTLSGCSRKGFERILIGISIILSFGNLQPGGFNPLYHFPDPFGLFEKGFRWILLWISLSLSFGNPQPRGFNPLYPFHDPFGLFEERNQADSSPHPLETSNREVSTLCILSLTLSGCSRKGFGRISFPNIPIITLSSRSRWGVRWMLMQLDHLWGGEVLPCYPGLLFIN